MPYDLRSGRSPDAGRISSGLAETEFFFYQTYMFLRASGQSPDGASGSNFLYQTYMAPTRRRTTVLGGINDFVCTRPTCRLRCPDDRA